MAEIFFLIIGLAGLWLGAELTIRGALNVAEHFKISYLFIGLTIMTFGTDLPELFVNVNASIQRLGGLETSGLIVGQTIGSVLSQIALVLGIAGLMGAMAIPKRLLLRDGSMLIISVIIFWLASLDGYISRPDGAILILIYLFYFIVLYREEDLYEKVNGHHPPKLESMWAILSMLAGLIFLGLGSHLTIENALSISETLGAPQFLMGILVVGLGTSLPELVTIFPAIRNKAEGLVVGNLIGSNIFDVLVTLGASAMIAGFKVDESLIRFDMTMLLLVSILVVLFFASKKRLTRMEALILIIVYVLYFSLRLENFIGFL